MITVTSLQTGFSTTTSIVDRVELYEKPRPRDLLQQSRCTVLAGDLEHRQVIEQALVGERLLALSPGQDPISAISAWLQGSPSQELHLVAHGAPGQISLGHGVDRLNLLQRAEQIGRWGVERIYLWSCRVGADLAFVSALQELSGARVFASAEQLGLGKTLMGTSFPELAAGVAALPLELAAGDPFSGSLANALLFAGVNATPNSDFNGFNTFILDDTSVTAASLNTLNELTTGAIDATRATALTGTAAAIASAISAEGIDTANGLGVTIAAGTASASDLKTIDANTDATVNATGVAGITGLVADVKDVIASSGINISTSYDVTLSDSAVSVADANIVDEDTSGVITATISEGSMSSLMCLNGSGNAYRITVTDASVNAADLNTLDGKTTVAVNAGSVGTLTGTAGDIATAISASTIDTASNVIATVSSGSATVAQANTIDANTTGVVTATISDTSITTLGGLTGTGNAYTVTVTDASVNAADLNTLDGKTTVAVNAGSVGTLTGTAGDIATAISASTIDTASNVIATVSSGSATVAQANTIDANTTGVVTATISDTSITTLGGLTGTGNAYTVTVTDASVNAADLNTLDAKTSLAIDASAVTAISGSTLDVTKALNSPGIGILNNASLLITYLDSNQGPTAVVDSISLGEDGSIRFDAGQNDIDPDSDQLTVVEVTNATGNLGSVSLDPDGQITYNASGRFDSLVAGEMALENFNYVVSDNNGGLTTGQVDVTITGVNDSATITPSAFQSDAAGNLASAIQLTETTAALGVNAEDAFTVSDVDYGEQEFQATSVKQMVEIVADGEGAYQSADASGRAVGSFSLDASTVTNTVDAGALTGQTADLSITNFGGESGFDSLAAGETATASIVLTSEDGTATVTSNVTIIGENDEATIIASAFQSDAAGDLASAIQLTEAAAEAGASAADAFTVSDVDYGEQEFQATSVKQTVEIVANGAGSYQNANASGRVVGSFSLDASAGTNTVDEGAVTGQTADLSITNFGGESGFDSLAAGETATASIALISEDGTATVTSNVTIIGENDAATITTSAFESDAAGDQASAILLSEGAAVGGRTAADAFAVSDVDYGEQEFRTAQQTVNILANSAGAYQSGGTANRVVGSFSLDASATSNPVDAGAQTGQTADLAITDLGGANGFESLAAGETATASIALTSEDGTAKVVSNVTITGVNDTAAITPGSYKTDYQQGDFSASPVLSYADRYQVSDVDYGQQEFSSGNYSTTILVDASNGRSGEALGRFSIVSDGSSSAGQALRDAGSVNEQSADVVISVDPSQSVGRVFDFGAVLDADPANTFGVQLNNSVNGGRGSNGFYDLSDLSVGTAGYGHLEVYRYSYDGEGNIADGSWSTDRNPLNVGDSIRLVGGINSLAYGESASATLSVASEDGTAISASTTVSITGSNDAPVVDTSKQLRSFELYGTFTVAEMLGFVDPSKTLITDVDQGSLPESIAITKLTPTGGFADADTGTLQRYDEATDEWVDIDVKNVSESNKLLLKSNDVLRFNANAEAYVSAALDKGSDQGGGIFDVEFRAWDRAYDQQLASETKPDADLSTLFSSGLQTISLALATSGERANATDLTYIPGQAVGIDGSNISVAGDLNIQTPVKGSVAGAGSSVYDNAVALVDGTSFGGIHGVGNANNIISDGNAVINAQAEGFVSVDASNYFDSFDDATDADATARLGIKSGPVGSGLVANGAFGVRDVDLTVGADLDLTGVVLGKTLATSRSMDGRAHAGSQFSSSAGIANTEVDVAGDMKLAANGGILTTVDAYSRNGSALADSTAAAAYGVVSGLKGSETSFDVGGDLIATAGLSVTMKTEATMVGDGVDNNNGFSFDDEVIAETEIGKSFGFGALSSDLDGLSVDVGDMLALSVSNASLLDTRAMAVTGDATAVGRINGNTGIYRADLQAGGAGDVAVSVDGVIRSLAETTTGDVLAKGFGLHTVGIESSDFDFKDPGSSLSVDVNNDVQALASTKHGAARSLIASSSAGMLGSVADDTVRSVESVNVLVHDQGFAQAAGISGTGASATAQQSGFGISGYSFATDEAMDLAVSNAVDSRADAAIVQWA